MSRSKSIASMKSPKRKKPKKIYRDKTLEEHARDGLFLILKTLKEEDKKMYHVMEGSMTVEIMGNMKKMVVLGKAKIGYFDVRTDKHHENIPVSFRFEAGVESDNWGVPTLSLHEYNVEGVDHLAGPSTPIVLGA